MTLPSRSREGGSSAIALIDYGAGNLRSVHNALVAAGAAQFGILGAVGVHTQRAAGADLQVVLAVVQHETGRLVFNGERDDIGFQTVGHRTRLLAGAAVRLADHHVVAGLLLPVRAERFVVLFVQLARWIIRYV